MNTDSALQRCFGSCSPFGGRDLLCIALLLAAVLLLGAMGISQGGLGWSDAPQHTFDGVFLLELFKQWPVQDLRSWAEQFYLRHPALGIVVYWPPGFAVFEAGVFALFGVSVLTARATVLCFAWGAAVLMYVLGKRLFDRPTGLLATLLLITCPHGVLWLNDVMLEWPALFWILAAVLAYQTDRASRKARWSVVLAITIIMAFLTKQTAAFILPVLLVHALLTADRRVYLLRPAFIASMLFAVAAVAGYWLLTRRYTALPASLLQPSLDLLFYPRHLPEIIGWPLMPLVLLGLGTFLVEPDRKARGLSLLWLAAWTAISTVISAKEPRYFFFAIPPLTLAAVRFFLPAGPASGSERPIGARSDAWRVAVLSLLVCVQAGLALSKSTGRLPSYAPAVARLVELNTDLVLVDAVRDGQFVLDVYRDPRTRDSLIPLRASKLLYARAAREQYDYRQFVNGPEDILALFHKYGIRHVLIESRLPRTPYLDADPPPRQMLRRLLAEDARFRLIGQWPLRCSHPAWDDVELRLYAYPACPARETDAMTISFPGMGRELTLQLP